MQAHQQYNPSNQLTSSNLGTALWDSRNDIFNADNYSSQTDYIKCMTKFFNLDNPAPFISARSWVMMDMDTEEVLYGKQDK